VGKNIDSAILYNIRVSLEKMEYEIVAFEGRLNIWLEYDFKK
jgi:hypothetical protein